jgi:hypothetical protein
MKTILHPDYWAEIPEGECLIGLTDEQRLLLWRQIRDKAGYAQRSPQEQERMDDLIEKMRGGAELTYEEQELLGGAPVPTFSHLPPRIVGLFYIALSDHRSV